MPEFWLLGAVGLGAAVGGFVQGLSGFAFSLLALSLWAWALPPQIAAPLAVFGALLGQVASLVAVRGGFEVKRIAPLVVGGALGVPIGVFLLHNVDPARFKVAIGALLTLYSLFGLLAPNLPRVKVGGRGLDAFVGLIGGVMGGLGGMSGSVPAMWTQLGGWKRDLRRATMQAYNIAMHTLTLAAYARTGTLDATAFRLFIVVAPAMLIPSYIGAHFYHRFSERTFERVVLGLLLASGVALFVGGVRALA
jgi:hypothetical protein